MSLSTTTNKVIYNGNASATSFSFTFPIPVASYLSVIYTDASGVETTLSSSLYSVTGIGTTTGGTVTYPLNGSPIATGTKLTILRTVPYTQDTVLSNQGGYYPEVVEGRLDRIYMAIQQLYERITNAFVAPVSDGTPPAAMPSSTVRANSGAGSFLAFDSLGNPYAATLTALAGVSTWIQNNLLPAASASAARTALGALGPGDAITLPSGRLTLTSGAPVMTSNVGSSATVYYTPYDGNLVPIYNGTAFVLTAFTELSNVLANSSAGKAGPAAGAASKNYDLFAWSDSGTVRLTRGAAWNSDTARSATTENDLQRINGIPVNLNAITNGPAAGVGTYVGSIRTDSGGATVTWNTGGVDTPAVLNVWNCYNRRRVAGLASVSTDTWNYTTNTIRAANGANTMRASSVTGLQEDFFRAQYSQRVVGAGINGALIGIGLDSTTTLSGRVAYIATEAGGNTALPVHASLESQLLGFHFMQACERGDSAVAATFAGDGGLTFQLSGLEYQGMF